MAETVGLLAERARTLESSLEDAEKERLECEHLRREHGLGELQRELDPDYSALDEISRSLRNIVGRLQTQNRPTDTNT